MIQYIRNQECVDSFLSLLIIFTNASPAVLDLRRRYIYVFFVFFRLRVQAQRKFASGTALPIAPVPCAPPPPPAAALSPPTSTNKACNNRRPTEDVLTFLCYKGYYRLLSTWKVWVVRHTHSSESNILLLPWRTIKHWSIPVAEHCFNPCDILRFCQVTLNDLSGSWFILKYSRLTLIFP